jgi:glyoxylate/hydroxypyruvate reductase A
MIRALFSAPPGDWDAWEGPLQAAFAAEGLAVDLARDHDPALVDYVIYSPKGGLSDFSPFTRARAVLSLWAGVERIVGNPTLTQPLARMVDPSLRQGMVEYVAGHVLRHHLGMDRWVRGGAGWVQDAPPLAAECPVTVLGMGELGRACAQALASLGFPVTGWAATPREVAGVTVLSGASGLARALARARIVVLLLPLTPATEGLIGAQALAALPRGACLINVARGGLIDDAALLAALDSGQVAHATLDVFRTEPLPADHPFWSHPGVTVTPHISAPTRPATAAAVIAQNIRRDQAGQGLLYLVDRTRGY